MPRYTKRPAQVRAWDMDSDYPFLPNLEVSSHEPIYTGLLDADGDEIWREPNGIGFHAQLD